MAPPDKETPAPRVAARETGEVQRKNKASANHKLCANCRQPIAGASHHLVGIHVSCWIAAGGRVRRIRQAEVEQHLRAELEAWRDEYQQAERRLAAEGWLPCM